jgi:hypothetical protein
MGRAIRNAANNVSEASAEVDNTAVWASQVLAQVKGFLDKLEKNGALELEVEVPLGDNLAHLFGKEHLTIDGKIPMVKANIKVLWPS